MSDPQPLDSVSAPDSSGAADREARIEQLLLSGLDHYFAGEYERAISVWTRVVFLERNHDRARAYIERARSALAERQRESEELLGNGVVAYNSGEIERARELLTRAAELGSETAQLFVDRLNRMGPGVEGGPSTVRTYRPGFASRHGVTSVTARRWVTPVALAAVVAATMLVGGLPLGTWLSELEPDGIGTSASVPVVDLPVVRGAEMALAHARDLHRVGQLHDALTALDGIRAGDLLRQEADRLKADIQEQILTAAGLSATPSGLRP